MSGRVGPRADVVTYKNLCGKISHIPFYYQPLQTVPQRLHDVPFSPSFFDAENVDFFSSFFLSFFALKNASFFPLIFFLLMLKVKSLDSKKGANEDG